MATRSPAARIDEVNVAQDLRGRNHHVPMNHRSNVPDLSCILPRVPLDRPEATVANRTRRIEFGPVNTLHVTPIVERTISVYEADDALLGLNFNRQRQCRQALTDVDLLDVWNVIQPHATVHPIVDFRVRVAKRRAPYQKVMVTANGVKPRTIQPRQHLIGFGPTIDKIADREQSIDALVEPDGLEGLTQRGETAVDVAHGEISADTVARKSAQSATSNRNGRRRRRQIFNPYGTQLNRSARHGPNPLNGT